MNDINKWDYNEKKIKLIENNITIFEKICDVLEDNFWFYKMVQRESKKLNKPDLLKVFKKIDEEFSENFSIKLLAKCILMSLASQELKDSSYLRHILGNKCCLMLLNTIINFEHKIPLINLDFSKILKVVVYKSILFLELKEVLTVKMIYSNKKKIVTVRGLDSPFEFNDDFRFQKTKYKMYQNFMCEYEEVSIGDIIISCEMYEFNQPFLIKNIKNKHINANNLTDIFDLINNEIIVDVEYYKIALNASSSDKWKNSTDPEAKKIKNKIRIINKKEMFLKSIELNNKIYFMKKICFRNRFYDVSELGVTSSKELRYAIIYEPLSKIEIEKKINEIKRTVYYQKIKEYSYKITLKELIMKNFSDFDYDGVLAIITCIIMTIGMEFKGDMLKNNIITNVENFIEIGEQWLKNYIKLGDNSLTDITDWEKKIYLKKLFNYIIEGNLANGMIINKDYSCSVYHNMVRMFGKTDNLRKAFNVGDCDNWSCGYTFLINEIKRKMTSLSEFEEKFLTKENLKRAIMCQPYNVGKTSAKLYMLEKVDKDEYKNNKDWYDSVTNKIWEFLYNLKKDLFKNEFDLLVKEVIENDFILELSDIKISMQYYKIDKQKRVIVKYRNKKKTMVIHIKSEIIDLRKTKRAMPANIMHSIDSFELRNIMKNLNKKKSKNIHAIHDCVICTVFDFFKINDIANRKLNYINKPRLYVIAKDGYSMYIFS